MSLACRGCYATEAVENLAPRSHDQLPGNHLTVALWALAVTRESVLISDGGLATELEARGHDLSDPLWSARLLADAPQEIVAVHAAYFRAGAAIATTASYQASFDGFAAHGIGRDGVAVLLRRSVELAKAARDEVGMRDGGWPRRSVRTARRWPTGPNTADATGCRSRNWPDGIAPGWRLLAEAGADVLALETVPDVDEAEALVDLVRSVGVPAWLSYTIDGTRTRAGQPLAEAFAVAAGVDEIVAVGVNCCAPDDVLPAIGIARVIDKPVIVYPNSGERWDGPGVDRAVAVLPRVGDAVGVGRRTHRRRMLPGGTRRYRRAGKAT